MKQLFQEYPKIDLLNEYSQYFNLVNKMLLIFDKVQASEHKISETKEYQLILLTSTSKTICTVLSISKLCNKGLVEDARSLLRKLLEVSASLIYINLDKNLKDSRSSRFYHHHAIKLRKLLDHVKSNPELFSAFVRDGLKEQEKKILEDYENAKVFFPLNENQEVEKQFKRYWDGKNINDIIKECEMSKEIIPYKSFSESIHFSSTDVVKIVDFKNFQIKTGIDTDEVPFLLIKCIQYAGQVIDFCNREFELGLEEDMKSLMDAILNAHDILVKTTGSRAI